MRPVLCHASIQGWHGHALPLRGRGCRPDEDHGHATAWPCHPATHHLTSDKALVGTRLAAVVALAALLAFTAAAAAAADPAADNQVGFERQGLEEGGLAALSYIKISLFAVFAAIAFYVCNWAFLDSRFVNTNQAAWDGIVLAGALAGLVAAVAVPIFFIGLPLGVILFGGAAVAYAMHRNSLVTPPLRVLTGAHLSRIKRHLLNKPVNRHNLRLIPIW